MPYISLLDTKKKTVNVHWLLQFQSLLILFAMLFSLFTEKKRMYKCVENRRLNVTLIVLVPRSYGYTSTWSNQLSPTHEWTKSRSFWEEKRWGRRWWLCVLWWKVTNSNRQRHISTAFVGISIGGRLLPVRRQNYHCFEHGNSIIQRLNHKP